MRIKARNCVLYTATFVHIAQLNAFAATQTPTKITQPNVPKKNPKKDNPVDQTPPSEVPAKMMRLLVEGGYISIKNKYIDPKVKELLPDGDFNSLTGYSLGI